MLYYRKYRRVFQFQYPFLFAVLSPCPFPTLSFVQGGWTFACECGRDFLFFIFLFPLFTTCGSAKVNSVLDLHALQPGLPHVSTGAAPRPPRLPAEREQAQLRQVGGGYGGCGGGGGGGVVVPGAGLCWSLLVSAVAPLTRVILFTGRLRASARGRRDGAR